LFEAKSLKRRNISNGSQSPKSHTMKNNWNTAKSTPTFFFEISLGETFASKHQQQEATHKLRTMVKLFIVSQVRTTMTSQGTQYTVFIQNYDTGRRVTAIERKATSEFQSLLLNNNARHEPFWDTAICIMTKAS
jgi:hypothetical protein